MPNERNIETQQALKRELKVLQGRCVEAINIIENAPLETHIDPEIVSEKALCYVEGLRTEIENSNTPITTDENLLTSQFLNEMKEKTSQVEELAAFFQGTIYDVDAQIFSLNNQIKIAQETKARPGTVRQQVQPEHLQRAKEQFQKMKTELQGLIYSLYPDKADAMKDVLGQLMSERLLEGSNGYILITSENFCLVELLKERNIVSSNPYNNMEVKLAY